MSESGCTVSTIARRAGVGIAAHYRRFPTREHLVTEAFADQLTTCASVVDDGLAAPDPWRGFCSAIERVCAMQTADQGLSDTFLTAFPDTDLCGEKLQRTARGLTELTRRAKESGWLRADFAQEDFTLVLLANRGVIAGPPETAAAASRRLVAHLIRSFEQTGESSSLLPAPPVGLGWVYGDAKGRRLGPDAGPACTPSPGKGPRPRPSPGPITRNATSPGAPGPTGRALLRM